MKKLTIKGKLYQCRISRMRLMERSNRKGKSRSEPSKKYIPPGELIRAPRSFNLILGAGLEVCKFLRATNRRVLHDKKPVRLDFRWTEEFHVPGTILLFAEIDKIVALSELSKPITIIDPRRRRPREVLKQIGIHQVTGDNCDIIPEREDVVYWKATKGNTQSGDSYGSLVEAIAEKANKDHAKHLEVSGLWRSVNEAIANSIDHAYKKPRHDNFSGLPETKWWMFSQIKDGTFTLAVCDLGCGYKKTIDETIPEKFVATIFEKFSGENRDALAIHTAMEFGRSGTHQSHRGKGSRDVLSLLQKHGDGELVVVSNTGWLRYEYSRSKETDRNTGSIGIDTGGTIVWWKLPLKDSNHENS